MWGINSILSSWKPHLRFVHAQSSCSSVIMVSVVGTSSKFRQFIVISLICWMSQRRPRLDCLLTRLDCLLTKLGCLLTRLDCLLTRLGCLLTRLDCLLQHIFCVTLKFFPCGEWNMSWFIIKLEIEMCYWPWALVLFSTVPVPTTDWMPGRYVRCSIH